MKFFENYQWENALRCYVYATVLLITAEEFFGWAFRISWFKLQHTWMGGAMAMLGLWNGNLLMGQFGR